MMMEVRRTMDQTARTEDDIMRIRVYVTPLATAQMAKPVDSDTEDSSYRPEAFRVCARPQDEIVRLGAALR